LGEKAMAEFPVSLPFSILATNTIDGYLKLGWQSDVSISSHIVPLNVKCQLVNGLFIIEIQGMP
jgi:hypothetical protein